MKVLETREAEPQALGVQALSFPSGLLGLEQIKSYALVADPAENPFIWLQSTGASDIAFLVVSPFLVLPEYQPDISEADVESLGLKHPNDALVLNIVTLRGAGAATVNLKGPILVNRHTHVGRQVVLTNASEYSVRHPISA